MARFIQQHFPECSVEIEALYLNSLEFREICHDFGVCLEKIERLKTSEDITSASVKQRLEQLSELHHELELEIIDQLQSDITTRNQEHLTRFRTTQDKTFFKKN